MDPITISAVAALTATAAAMGNGVASAASKDAYESLKRLVTGRFAAAKLALLEVEKAPTHAALAIRLEEAGAAGDEEFRRCVEILRAALRQEPETRPLFDVDEMELTKTLKMHNVSAAGAVLKARKIVAESMDLSNIHQTGGHQTGGDPEKH